MSVISKKVDSIQFVYVGVNTFLKQFFEREILFFQAKNVVVKLFFEIPKSCLDFWGRL